MLSMWFSELISEEGLGNGSSMIIFINIVGSLPNSFTSISNALFNKSAYLLSMDLVVYLEHTGMHKPGRQLV